MQTHKMIYVSFIVLLTVSLLISSLIADICPYCENDPCTCFTDDEGVPEVIFDANLRVAVLPEIVEKPSNDVIERIKLQGQVYITSEGYDYGVEGVPVEIEVYGPGGFHKSDFIGLTKTDGYFDYEFQIFKTAYVGRYDVFVKAASKQAKVSFEVVEKTWEVTFKTNLPTHLTADLKLDGSSLSGPFNSGSPKKIELSGEYAYTCTTEEVVEDPENKSIRYRCKTNKVDVTGELNGPRVITFEYEIENRISIEFHPEEMIEYFETKDFECEEPYDCHVYGGLGDTLNYDCEQSIEVSPGEKKVFRNWQFETYSGDNRTSKFYDDTIINIPYTYPGTIYIYYDTYYDITVESNKEDLGFSLWAIENSNVSLPPLRIPILFGLGGEWIGEVTGNKSVLGTDSIENVDGPEKLCIHYEYNWPWIILIFFIGPLVAWLLKKAWEKYFGGNEEEEEKEEPAKQCQSVCPTCGKQCYFIVPKGEWRHEGRCRCTKGYDDERVRGRLKRRKAAGHNWEPKDTFEYREGPE